jgi:hypothetical protein
VPSLTELLIFLSQGTNCKAAAYRRFQSHPRSLAAFVLMSSSILETRRYPWGARGARYYANVSLPSRMQMTKESVFATSISWGQVPKI